MLGRRILTVAALLVAAVPAAAQVTEVRPISGTRLDVVVTGEVARVPDVVLIHAGVMTRAPTANEAIRSNGAAMDRLRQALRDAGIEPRDLQTSSVHLQPEWRHSEGAAPVFAGYQAAHRLTVRFRDAANAGRILDALVVAGANTIDGPSFQVTEANVARDEARNRALVAARSRADLYARALGMRVARVLAVSETGGRGDFGFAQALSQGNLGATNIALGEEMIAVTLAVAFELE